MNDIAAVFQQEGHGGLARANGSHQIHRYAGGPACLIVDAIHAFSAITFGAARSCLAKLSRFERAVATDSLLRLGILSHLPDQLPLEDGSAAMVDSARQAIGRVQPQRSSVATFLSTAIGIAQVQADAIREPLADGAHFPANPRFFIAAGDIHQLYTHPVRCT